MKVLFVHQNFPGQFLHLAPALAARGHDVRALTAETNRRPAPVPVLKYRWSGEPAAQGLGARYAQSAERGWRAARAAQQMRTEQGYVPDVVFGHPGWGETLFLREVWPEARHLVYAEWMYQGAGLDSGFDPEFARPALAGRVSTVARAAHLVQAMIGADAALSPTRFQAQTFPAELRSKITLCHDGIDTARVHPDPAARYTLPDGSRTFRACDEVLTYVSRSLEPYRGIHTFLRALPEVLEARPGAHVLIVGQEGQSYGPAPATGSWKDRFLAELDGRLDLSRVHFTGRVTYADFISILQVGRVHAYLTYPFVLSWSLLEAIAAGAMVVASDTGPLREVIEDGVTGRLVDFFDVPGWSRALIAALADPAAHAPLRAAARARVVADYDLNTVCLPRLIDFVESGPSR
ncbi:glycosyltransferase [Paenirhodobacter populi]|uniref:Glycosyltransferase n=1 Tax=Paenirhodobacter populi TaxID=2306993 RepID=A0A443JNU4_9RHOB|nr:glycosyltransferase [Sinirhodobacter populi]RWR22154.1 glycosyltransferase [Sinirhodobacter populi]